MSRRILVVEDEPGIAFGLEADLRTEGHAVTVATTGDEALKIAGREAFDLVLLDIMLPGKDGFEVCRELRRGGVRTPIIMLTARAHEAEKVMGLELGADDYITKPFSPRELRARVKAALRRSADEAPDIFRFGDTEVDFARCEVRRGDKVVDLSALEFKLLATFIRRHEQSFEVSPIVTPRPGALELWSPDEKTMYFRRSDARGAALIARDLETGAEREVFRQTENGSMTLSPDGRYIASVVRSVLYLVPTAGGAAKEVLRAKGGERFDGFRAEWTPDGRSLLLPRLINDQAIELWLVPMFDGGELHKLDVDTSAWVLPGGGFAIRPNGRQIAYVGMAGKQGAEVWALENLLRTVSANKPTVRK